MTMLLQIIMTHGVGFGCHDFLEKLSEQKIELYSIVSIPSHSHLQDLGDTGLPRRDSVCHLPRSD